MDLSWMNMYVNAPEYVRLFLLVLLTLLVIRSFVMRVIPLLFANFILLVEKVLALLFISFDLLMGVIVTKLAQSGKRDFSRVNAMENRMTTTLLLLKKLRKKHSLLSSLFMKRYILLASIALCLLITYNPTYYISQSIYDGDQWVLSKLKKKDHMEEVLGKEIEDSSEQLKLSDGIKWANVRLKPVSNLDTNNSIKVIGSEETVIFLNEEVNMGSYTWLKVKTASGEIGWVEKSVVQKYNN